jgi:hypothetical protein
MKTEKRYTLWSFDVWGNETDGFDINDRYKQSSDFVVETEAPDGQPTDAELLAALQSAGYIKPTAKLSDIDFDGDDMQCHITQTSNGYPLYGLELNQ